MRGSHACNLKRGLWIVTESKAYRRSYCCRACKPNRTDATGFHERYFSSKTFRLRANRH